MTVNILKCGSHLLIPLEFLCPSEHISLKNVSSELYSFFLKLVFYIQHMNFFPKSIQNNLVVH